jgi:hypothetical protein
MPEPIFKIMSPESEVTMMLFLPVLEIKIAGALRDL